MHDNNDYKLINRTNNAFCDGFLIAALTAQEMNCIDDCEFAVKRIFSYNPVHEEVLKDFPKYKNVVHFLQEKIENEVSKENVDWVKLGHCYLTLGDFPNAFAAYAHAQNETKEINDPIYKYTIGIVYQHYNYFEHAQMCFEKILKDYPDFIYLDDLYFRLACLFRSLKRYNDSILYFSKIKDSPPNGLTSDDISIQIAHVYHLMDDNINSGNIYRELIEKYPDNIKLKQEYIWFLLSTSTSDQLIEVSQVVNDILTKHPYEPTFLLISARLSMKLNNYANAYNSFRCCMDYWNDNALYWFDIGTFYCQNNQMNDAIISFQKSIYLKKDLAEAWLNMGYSYEQQRDYQSAVNVYSISSQNCPDNAEILNRLINLQSKTNYQYVSRLIEIQDSKNFLQFSDELANDYIKAVPILPSSCYDNDEIDFEILSTFPKSVFLDEKNQ